MLALVTVGTDSPTVVPCAIPACSCCVLGVCHILAETLHSTSFGQLMNSLGGAQHLAEVLILSLVSQSNVDRH